MLTDPIAKASPKHTQSGIRTMYPFHMGMSDIYFQFKENPDAWLLVDKILTEASYPQTKCELALLPSCRYS